MYSAKKNASKPLHYCQKRPRMKTEESTPDSENAASTSKEHETKSTRKQPRTASTTLKFPKTILDKSPIVKWLNTGPKTRTVNKKEPLSFTANLHSQPDEEEEEEEPNCCHDFFDSKTVVIFPAETDDIPLEMSPSLPDKPVSELRKRNIVPPRRVVVRSETFETPPKTRQSEISPVTPTFRSGPKPKIQLLTPTMKRPSLISEFATPRSATWTPARVDDRVVEAKRRRTRSEVPTVVNFEPKNAQAPFVSYRSVPAYDLSAFDNIGDDLRYFDTHCHLDFLFKRLSFKGTHCDYISKNKGDYLKQYGGCVAVFCDPSTFPHRTMWAPLIEEKTVWAAFGCHPHLVKSYDEDAERNLVKALRHPKVVALGEIGLDYSPKNNCDHDLQKAVFVRQIELALERCLPLVIHSRNALEDTLSIMREHIPRNHRIHWHCFTQGWNEARTLLKEFPNLYLGLTALVTFPTAKHVHEVARRIPLDRLLLETDSPYFLPRNEPTSKRWSNPGMAAHVAAQIAALRGDDTLEDVIQATRQNTNEMYGI